MEVLLKELYVLYLRQSIKEYLRKCPFHGNFDVDRGSEGLPQTIFKYLHLKHRKTPFAEHNIVVFIIDHYAKKKKLISQHQGRKSNFFLGGCAFEGPSFHKRA